VPISAFASLGYCERQVYLSLVRGLRITTQAMRRGRVQHRISELTEEPRLRRMPGLMQRMRQHESVLQLPRESVGVGFKYGGYSFAGRIDLLIKRRGEILVVDEKFVRRSHGRMMPGYRYQLSAYCHALRYGYATYRGGGGRQWLGRFPGCRLSYMVIERHRESRHRLSVLQESYAEEQFMPVLRRMVEILSGEEPKPEYSSKCRYCRFREVCVG